MERTPRERSASRHVDTVAPHALAEIAGVLREVTGEDERWAAAVTPESRLEDDLRLESVEVAALGEALRARWGVDLPAYLAGLDLDQLIDLTVGDLARLVKA